VAAEPTVIGRFDGAQQGRRCSTQSARLQQAAEAIVARHAVAGVLRLLSELLSRAKRAAYRHDGQRQIERNFGQASVPGSRPGLERSFGWRVYVTNQTTERLS